MTTAPLDAAPAATRRRTAAAAVAPLVVFVVLLLLVQGRWNPLHDLDEHPPRPCTTSPSRTTASSW